MREVFICYKHVEVMIVIVQLELPEFLYMSNILSADCGRDWVSESFIYSLHANRIR